MGSYLQRLLVSWKTFTPMTSFYKVSEMMLCCQQTCRLLLLQGIRAAVGAAGGLAGVKTGAVRGLVILPGAVVVYCGVAGILQPQQHEGTAADKLADKKCEDQSVL